MTAKNISSTLDTDTIKEITDAFSSITGAGCTVYSTDNCEIYSTSSPCDVCSFKHKLFGPAASDFDCAKDRSFASESSIRFGGRYSYLCRIGLAFVVSPITAEGKNAGSISCGPLMIIDYDDFFDNELFNGIDKDSDIFKDFSAAVKSLPKLTPKQLDMLSSQLFANAVYISDSSQTLLNNKDKNDSQNQIGAYIAKLKRNEEKRPYPMNKEFELCNAVSCKDKKRALELLNEMLGYIFFYTESPVEIRTRTMELLVVISRAAISGGGDGPAILDTTGNLLRRLAVMRSQSEITPFLASNLQSFMELMQDIPDAKHTSMLTDAIDYINGHFEKRLTLEETAAVSGYSPNYFSKVFKEETGLSFKEYLNRLRIDKSKLLLLDRSISVSEISGITGFSDQSYFCKIFKKYTGTTPETFRLSIRRIDHNKEHGKDIPAIKPEAKK